MLDRYMSGFGNDFATEALELALPAKGHSPLKPLHGLYAEQLAGPPGAERPLRSWLYRIRPSVLHDAFTLYTHPTFVGAPFNPMPTAPNPLRWDPLPVPKKPVDFVDGIMTVAGGGDAAHGLGTGVHVYVATAARRNRFFCNADGDMLFVPEHGAVSFRTEMGVLDVTPGEIAVIPRGIRFAVALPDTTARGYICENFGAPFTLPEAGPRLGAMAYPRHFLYPVAAFEDREGEFELICKFDGALWQATTAHSPLDVAAWQGNYAPYKYALENFMTLSSANFDRPDPGAGILLSSPGNADVTLWAAAGGPPGAFPLPPFRRAAASVFSGLVRGTATGGGTGFQPGGATLHNSMIAHGPDAASWQAAAETKPNADSLAFSLESRFILRPTLQALNRGLQPGYGGIWRTLPRMFKGT